MNFIAFSISAYVGPCTKSKESTNNNPATHKNCGPVELMILHTLDQLISSKVKWCMGKDLLLMSKQGIERQSSITETESIIILQEVIHVKDTPKQIILSKKDYLDPSLRKLEINLEKHAAILSFLLEKYECLTFLGKTRIELSDWKQNVYVQIRQQLVDLFTLENRSRYPLLPILIKNTKSSSPEMSSLHKIKLQTLTNGSRPSFSPKTPLTHYALFFK